jgi:hypothetical protein
VRNLPIKVTSQGATNSGKPIEKGDLKLTAFRLHLEKTKLYGSARWKLKTYEKTGQYRV